MDHEIEFHRLKPEDKLMTVLLHVKDWTKEQIESMSGLYTRSPVYRGGISSNFLVTNEGWTFNNHCDIPLHIHSGLWLWSHPGHPEEFFTDHHDIIMKYKLGTPIPLDEFMMRGQMDDETVMIHVTGLTIGIEKDGYTHS